MSDERGDRMLGEIVAAGAWRQGWISVVVGIGSAALSGIACVGVPVPVLVWSFATVVPIVGGLLATAGAWQAWSTLRNAPEEALLALSATEKRGPVVFGAIGAVLGLLGAANGAISLALTQIGRAF